MISNISLRARTSDSISPKLGMQSNLAHIFLGKHSKYQAVGTTINQVFAVNFWTPL